MLLFTLMVSDYVVVILIFPASCDKLRDRNVVNLHLYDIVIADAQCELALMNFLQPPAIFLTITLIHLPLPTCT